MTIKAKEILNGKFWIVEKKGNNIGTISFNDDRFMLNNASGTCFFENENQLKKKLGEEIHWQKLNITEILPPKKDVYGFPTSCVPFNPVYDVKRKLPMFSKSKKSKSLYCAGYFIIRFNKGWVKSFCPKLITIERYENKGPFRTELEMRQELSNANKN